MDYMGSDLAVVNAARVSFHKESDWERGDGLGGFAEEPCLSERDQKLISYLARHNHWSPFAHTSLQFRIQAPIFVARQLVKHQVGGVWNEVSRRYVDDEPVFYFPEVWRARPEDSVKQGSGAGSVNVHHAGYHVPTDTTQFCLDAYNILLGKGVAPEQARMILPQNTMTEWIWTGSLYFFARVCKQRLDPHAQAETREVAQAINDLVPKEFEHAWKALMNNEQTRAT